MLGTIVLETDHDLPEGTDPKTLRRPSPLPASGVPRERGSCLNYLGSYGPSLYIFRVFFTLEGFKSCFKTEQLFS